MLWYDERCHCLEHRNLDALAAAALLSGIQSHRNGLRDVKADNFIGNDRVNVTWLIAAVSLQARQAAGCLDRIVHCSVAGVRCVLRKAKAAAIDQPLVALSK